jgi:hypothetical protein
VTAFLRAVLARLVALRRGRRRHPAAIQAPAAPVPPAPTSVDAYARSALEKAEHKLVELDWRLRAVEAERDTHALPWLPRRRP